MAAMSLSLPEQVDRRTRRERLLSSRQCPYCHTSGFLEVVPHPAASLLRCRRCTRVVRTRRHLSVVP